MIAERLRRFIAWHAGSRAPLSSALYKFSRRYVMAWSNVEANPAINGERWLVQTITRLSGDGAVFFDVGANVGEWSKLVATSAPRARLLAFEPVHDVRKALANALADTGAEVFSCALSDKAGTAAINYMPAAAHFSSLETIGQGWASTGGQIEIELRTGDDVCEDQGVIRIRLLKVDTEGHDLKTIRGFRKMLDAGAIDVIQFEYNFMAIYSRTFLKDFFDELAPAMRIGRLLRNRVEYFDYHPALDNFIQANFIAVRHELADGELKALAYH